MQPSEYPGELPSGGYASDELAELCANFLQLGPRARLVARELLKRLRQGAAYGDFDGRRNYVCEAREEIIDALAYLAVGLAEPRPSGGAVGGPGEDHGSA